MFATDPLPSLVNFANGVSHIGRPVLHMAHDLCGHFTRAAPLRGRLVGNQLPGPNGHRPRSFPVTPNFIEKGAADVVRDTKFIDRKYFAANSIAFGVHIKRLQCLSDIGGFDGRANVCEECERNVPPGLDSRAKLGAGLDSRAILLFLDF